PWWVKEVEAPHPLPAIFFCGLSRLWPGIKLEKITRRKSSGTEKPTTQRRAATSHVIAVR
ncbi:MAG: hypothetical protein WAL20_01295, partial [Rhodomicrobium sp.]